MRGQEVGDVRKGVVHMTQKEGLDNAVHKAMRQ